MATQRPTTTQQRTTSERDYHQQGDRDRGETSLAAPTPQAIAARRRYLAKTYDLSEEQVDIVRDQICPKATDAELEFFLVTAKRMKLDPFARQIYFIKRRQKFEDRFGNEDYIDVGRPEVSIDGLRSCAEQTGEYDGQSPIQWCGPDGQWTEVWLSDSPPLAARATVHRKTFGQPTSHVAHFSEFAPPRFKNGALPAMWSRMPANQIAKCAEAGAFRKAFPRDMSGVYITEEMEHTAQPSGYQAPPPASSSAAASAAPTIDVEARPHKPDSAVIASMLMSIAEAVTREDLAGVGTAVTNARSRVDDHSKEIVARVAPVLAKRYRELPPAAGARSSGGGRSS